ncbi:MAG: hypothetical protein ACN23H_01140 [Candidatus Phytoplasma vitis]|nr:MAG: hypothetical protein M6G77_01015 [Candidatus Phytoplasma vitis]
MKSNSNKIDFKKISELIFFIGSFFMSGFIIVILITASIECKGLSSYFLFDYISIFSFLCFITFFIHITKFKNNKIHSWINLITLITGCMSYIKYSPEIASNHDLFFNRYNTFCYLYRLLIMILPFLFIFYYLCLAKDVPSSKMKNIVIICYPIIYIVSKTILLDFLTNKSLKIENALLSMGGDVHTIIFNILKLYSRFLLLIPCVLGILLVKKEILNKEKIQLALIYIGCSIVALSFGGFWYPCPFKKEVMKTLFKDTQVSTFLQDLCNYNEYDEIKNNNSVQNEERKHNVHVPKNDSRKESRTERLKRFIGIKK